MKKVVVVGTDGTEPAAKAVATAAALASAFGVELVVVKAFEGTEVETPGGLEDIVPISAADAANAVAQQAIDELRADYPRLTMTARSAVGKPEHALIEVADEQQASVIVVGNKRVQGITRVLGSIAQHVAHKASCDVYIAHTQER